MNKVRADLASGWTHLKKKRNHPSFFFFCRHHLHQHPPHCLHGPRRERDPGPGWQPLPGGSAGEQDGPGVPNRGVDGVAQLRLRGLHSGSVHRRPEQGRATPGRDPEGHGGQTLLLQGASQTVPEQPVPKQRRLQGGLEPLRVRLLRYWIPRPLLWKRYDSGFLVLRHFILRVRPHYFWTLLKCTVRFSGDYNKVTLSKNTRSLTCEWSPLNGSLTFGF